MLFLFHLGAVVDESSGKVLVVQDRNKVKVSPYCLNILLLHYCLFHINILHVVNKSNRRSICRTNDRLLL